MQIASQNETNKFSLILAENAKIGDFVEHLSIDPKSVTMTSKKRMEIVKVEELEEKELN